MHSGRVGHTVDNRSSGLFLLSDERLFSSDTGTYKEARAFFTSPKSLVLDYFDGNLASLSSTINAHTFVFAMYYASESVRPTTPHRLAR